MGKRLLIIGNGFDLAHKLPTRYADFLNFSFMFRTIYTYAKSCDDYYKYSNLISKHLENEYLKSMLLGLFKNRLVSTTKLPDGTIDNSASLGDESLDRMASDLERNIWFEYFLFIHKKGLEKGRNWIDFESEISDVIQFIDFYWTNPDKSFPELQETDVDDKSVNGKIRQFFKLCDSVSITVDCGLRIEDFINRLYDDLERITDALDIYLSYFVEKMDVSQQDAIKSINPDCVISFNYTHTYHNIYDNKVPVCYIHGECGNHSNMVIGIDEYLDPVQRNINTKMSIFKKFVQRIRKRNDTIYRQWQKEMLNMFERTEPMIRNSTNPDAFNKNYSGVYVYGHSLDVTDIDVLRLFLEPEYTSLHIYAKGKMEEGRLISNLIKIIGEDTLIEKSYGTQERLELIVL